MRKAIILIAACLAAGAAVAGARPDWPAEYKDALDGWCAQVKKASSSVICSDIELRQQAIARNKLFEAAREKLSPDEYKALSEDQTRWAPLPRLECSWKLSHCLI